MLLYHQHLGASSKSSNAMMVQLRNLLSLLVSSLLEGAHCSEGCCGTLQVVQKDESDPAARLSQPNIFTNYTIEADLVNGRVHYTSHDGTKAIAYHEDHGQWYIQPADRR